MSNELILSLKTYKTKNLLSDIPSGFLVAIVALPLSIALGIQSGATLQAGIIAAVIGGFCIATFGGSKFSIGGPSATFVVVTLSYISNPAIGYAGMLFITLGAGLVLITAGFLRAGKLLKYLPFSVVIGFTSGVGVILLTAQLKDFFGLTLPAGTSPDFLPKVIALIKAVPSFDWRAFVLGASCLTLIFTLQKINKKIPAVFIVVATATLASFIVSKVAPDRQYFSTIGSAYGDIRAEFNFIEFKSIAGLNLGLLIVPILLIALLSAMEGLMSAAVAEGMTKQPHDPNMELVGHGIANAASALFGGIPVAGVLARTSFNIGSGAKSPLSGMFHATFLLIMYLTLMPLIKFIPFATLAAVLIRVAINMSRFPIFFKYVRFGIRDGITLLATFFGVLLLGVAYGVLMGIVLSFIENITYFKHPLKITESHFEETIDSETGSPLKQTTLVLEGALNFFSVNRLAKTILERLKAGQVVYVDFARIKRVDATVCDRLTRLYTFANAKEKALFFTGMNVLTEKRYKT